jgi:hypothetical protein
MLAGIDGQVHQARHGLRDVPALPGGERLTGALARGWLRRGLEAKCATGAALALDRDEGCEPIGQAAKFSGCFLGHRGTPRSLVIVCGSAARVGGHG